MRNHPYHPPVRYYAGDECIIEILPDQFIHRGDPHTEITPKLVWMAFQDYMKQQELIVAPNGSWSSK